MTWEPDRVRDAMREHDALKSGEPTVEPLAVECKFTVESVGQGGLGALGEGRERRIEFEGYATMDVMRELSEAIRRVSMG